MVLVLATALLQPTGRAGAATAAERTLVGLPPRVARARAARRAALHLPLQLLHNNIMHAEPAGLAAAEHAGLLLGCKALDESRPGLLGRIAAARVAPGPVRAPSAGRASLLGMMEALEFLSGEAKDV